MNYQITDEASSYVTWTRGFKSGGYNLSSPGSAPFFPETIDAYEAGLKTGDLLKDLAGALAKLRYG